MGRAVSSAVVAVDDGADVGGAVADGCGSPPPHAVRPMDVAAIVRNSGTKDQERRTKDKGLFGNEHAYGALFDGLDGA